MVFLDGSPDLNHVVLLSDGKANCSILDPEELAEHASNLRARGVSTQLLGLVMTMRWPASGTR